MGAAQTTFRTNVDVGLYDNGEKWRSQILHTNKLRLTFPNRHQINAQISDEQRHQANKKDLTKLQVAIVKIPLHVI